MQPCSSGVAFLASTLLILLCIGKVNSISSGYSNCPCVDEVPPLIEEDEAIANGWGIDNITNYGIGCDKHDKKYNNFCQSNDTTPGLCKSEFCYVDPLNCNLPNRQSHRFPSSPRYFSFATCGYTDEWSRDPIRLKGEVLQGVLIDNHRGYEGTILNDINDEYIDDIPYDGRGVIRYHDNKQYYGTVIDLMEHLVNQTDLNFTINFTVIPEIATNHANNHQPFIDADENMEHAACVYASGTSAVDLCIGSFTKSRHRNAVSSFLEMGVSSEYLVVSISEPETTGELISSIFAPFSPALWGVTFAVLIVLSLLFAVQEAPRDWWLRFKEAPTSSLAHASYNALLRFWAHETLLPSDGRVEDGGTWAGRFTLLAIGVQILLTGSSYTANLTNYLVRNGFGTSITSIDQAIAEKYRICILKNRVNILQGIYGNKIRNVTVDSRSDLLVGIDDELCDAAIVGIEEMHAYHGKGEHCTKQRVGDPVLEMPWGIPVSEEYVLPLETVISETFQQGVWGNISAVHEPQSMCYEEMIDSDTGSLTPKHLSGAYVLSAVLVATGIIVGAISKSKRGSHVLPEDENSARMDDIYAAVANLTEKMEALEEKTLTNDSLREILSSDGDVKARKVMSGYF